MKTNSTAQKDPTRFISLSVRKWRLIAFALISFMLFSIFYSNAQTSLTVNTGTVIQSNFLGVNGVHNGSVYMDAQTLNGMTAANRAIVYDRLVKLGVRMVRTVYSPWYAARGNWNGTYDWNSREMTQFYNWLQDMKDRNIDVALNLGYYFPADVYNWTSGINEDVTGNLNRIADWTSQSIHQMVTVRGLTNVKYGILFTEPNTTPHNEVGGPPSGYSNWTFYKAVVQAMHNKLVADGRRNLIKLVGPNNTADGVNTGLAASELNGVIDIYAGHNYNKTNYTGWFNMATGIKNSVASTGKPYWIDEYGRQSSRDVPEYGNYIAQAVSAFINAGAQTSLIWQISEDRYSSANFPGANDNGFFMDYGSDRYVPISQVPYPSWYSLSLMAKYMGGPGTQVYNTTNSNSIYISATSPSAGNYSFLVVNGNASAQSIVVNTSTTIGGKTLYRYVYDPATVSPASDAVPIGYSQTYTNVATSFSDNIPALAVVVYSTIQGSPISSPPAGSNLAIGAAASASSTDLANGYSPAKAIDGNKANFAGWSSASGVPQWLLLDFGSAKTFNRVVLNTTTGYLLKDYDVQYWNGSTYVTSAQVRNNTFKEVTTTFTSVTSSRIRINCLAGDQWGLARIDELEVYNAVTVATASSTDTANGYTPAKAIDGNKANFAGWASLGTVPQWLLLDFGANKTFDKVVLNTTTGYLLKDYDIQSWNGSAYTTIVQVRNNTVKEVTTTFTSVTSSRVRINCITGDQYRLARIDELQVFNGNAAARLANSSSSESGGQIIVPENGFYQWKESGWVKYDGVASQPGAGIAVWHISKVGDVFVYDGNFGEKSDDKAFSLYPNPAKGEVVVSYYLRDAGDVSIQIDDMQGRRAKSLGALSQKIGLNQNTISLEGLKPGMYILRLKASEFSKSLQLVVEN
jgi:hypothetical protein